MASKQRTHIVQSGDTLWRIAERYYGDGYLYKQIAAANGLTQPDLIIVGQPLSIPVVIPRIAKPDKVLQSSKAATRRHNHAYGSDRWSDENLGLKTSPFLQHPASPSRGKALGKTVDSDASTGGVPDLWSNENLGLKPSAFLEENVCRVPTYHPWGSLGTSGTSTSIQPAGRQGGAKEKSAVERSKGSEANRQAQEVGHPVVVAPLIGTGVELPHEFQPILEFESTLLGSYGKPLLKGIVGFKGSMTFGQKGTVDADIIVTEKSTKYAADLVKVGREEMIQLVSSAEIEITPNPSWFVEDTLSVSLSFGTVRKVRENVFQKQDMSVAIEGTKAVFTYTSTTQEKVVETKEGQYVNINGTFFVKIEVEKELLQQVMQVTATFMVLKQVTQAFRQMVRAVARIDWQKTIKNVLIGAAILTGLVAVAALAALIVTSPVWATAGLATAAVVVIGTYTLTSQDRQRMEGMTNNRFQPQA